MSLQMSLHEFGQRFTTVVNTVRMSRKRRFVLVEGENDFRFLANYLASEVTLLHLGDVRERDARESKLGARDAVIKACQTLAAHRYDHYIGLADADLHIAIGATPNVPGLVFISISDARDASCIDLESSLIRTNALRKLCIEVLGSRIDSLGGIDEFVRQRREWLRQASMAVGAYRAAVMDFNRRGTNVGGIGQLGDEEWRQFVNLEAGTFSRERLDRLMATRISPQSESGAIRVTACDFEDNLRSTWLLSRGHDMTHLLSLAFSALSPRRVTVPEVESKLRVAFEASMLEDTAFGRQLRQLKYAETAPAN